jgi:DNA mismatch repair protein MutS
MDDAWGLLFGELMTAQLFATIIPAGEEKLLESELVRFFPDEVLLPNTKQGKSSAQFFKKRGYFTSLEHTSEDENAEHDAQKWIDTQFNEKIQKLLKEHQALTCAVSTFYRYLHKNQSSSLGQFKNLQFYQSDDFLVLDAATQKNLDLVKNSHDGTRKHTLFGLMDKAATSMGSRMVKKWLMRPLVKQQAIEQRLDIVDLLVQNVVFAQQIAEL